MSEESVVDPVAEPEPVAAPVDPPVGEPDPDDDASLEASAIVLPDGEGTSKYAPLAAVLKARERGKAWREKAEKADGLAAELDQARRALAESAPYVEAAKAILSGQSQPQAQPAPAEDTTELQEIAKDLDFYKPDGALDLDRARRHAARIDAAAERKAAERVAPIEWQGKIAEAKAVLSDAKAWKDPVTGEQADPVILANLWNRVATQPGGLDTLSNREAAMFIWGQAINLTRWQKGGTPAAAVKPASTPAGEPLFTEPSGGNARPVTLTSLDRKAAKDMGMSEAEYAKEVAKMPWKG